MTPKVNLIHVKKIFTIPLTVKLMCASGNTAY